jgi:L-rhamnose mutarotase
MEMNEQESAYGYDEAMMAEQTPEEQVLSQLDADEKKLYHNIQEKLRMTDPVLQALAEMENAPTDEMIESFKAATGDEVYFISLSDKENFVFRPIRRQEWRALMQQIAKLDEYKKAEAIVAKGILHPQISSVNIGALSAGSVETLREVILRASNFMDPMHAVSLVRKL